MFYERVHIMLIDKVNVWLSACFWNVGGNQSTRGKHTQAQIEHAKLHTMKDSS